MKSVKKLNKTNRQNVNQTIELFACYCACQCVLGMATQKDYASERAGR